MQLPIDVKAVIDEAMDIEGARTTPLSVSVYIDDSAPGDLIGHVRSAFASASAHTRVTIGYLDERPMAPFPGDDMAVLVAGLSERIGEHAAALRAAGVPVMVATTLPRLVESIAEAAGAPIPHGDVVAPEAPHGRLLGCGRDAQAVAVGAEADAAGDAAEPALLDQRAAALLDRRMGEWIIDACRDKRLAFALAFPFVRRPLSVDAVNATAVQNAGVGLVVFIPGADLPIMTLNQAKMLLRIAAAYGEPLGKERVKELAAVVGGAFACRSVARQIVAFVPALGWAVKAAIGYAGTLAMGRAAIEYFEDGGNVSGLVGVVSAARDKVVDAAAAARTCLNEPAGGQAAPAAPAPEPPARRVANAARTAAGRVQDVARNAVPLAKSVVGAGVEAAGADAGAVATTAAAAAFGAAKSRLRGRR